MTLVNRLSLFFLSMLALVLAGFSLALYMLADRHLNQQIDERLAAALRVLSAPVESDREGVEWDPHERPFASIAPGDTPLRWIVRDEHGQRVDGSRENDSDDFFAANDSADADAHEIGWNGERWRIVQREFPAQGSALTAAAGRPPEDRRAEKHLSLVLEVAISLAPVKSTLRSLLVVVSLLSLVLWSAVALSGRWLLRRALTPLLSMSTAARTMSASDFGQRLPSPRTGDELEELARSFNDLLSRLQVSFEQQRRFTGDASHELRTPLAAILGQVEVALRHNRSPEEYQRVLSLVQERGAHLHHIVEMLLFLARAEAETNTPGLETIDLPEWLNEYLKSWSDHPRRADMKLVVEYQGSCRVNVHPPLFGQLLNNLLENACKYSEAGSSILIRISNDRQSARVTIEDRGCGIAADELPHVFEPFFRSAHARAQGLSGVGLGLSVAKRIAAALHGRLSITSEMARGTCLSLYLPIAQRIENASLPNTATQS